VQALFTDYCELSGDRLYSEDPSIIGGFARFDGKPVMLLGHQKGRSTKENMARNFGMPRPEGYRKARRLMELGARFDRPILTFVDTPGAYPGIGAEERGQAEAIAVNLEVMASLPVPIISTVIGEGGSGGALAIGVGNRVLMMENSIYSVISPEACSSILYRDASMAEKAADALKLTARDLLELNVVDELVPEPPGGAHRDPAKAAESLAKVLRKHLATLTAMKPDKLITDRYAKFRALGVFAGK
jgi:acetyl-CoA carboxylase carboxyl transferase subunit alpha